MIKTQRHVLEKCLKATVFQVKSVLLSDAPLVVAVAGDHTSMA